MTDAPSPRDPAEPDPQVLAEEPGRDARFRRREPGPPRDALAIGAFALSLVGVHVVGIVLGHLALERIAKTGRAGRSLALAALVIGYSGLALTLAAWVLYFWLLAPVVTLPG